MVVEEVKINGILLGVGVNTGSGVREEKTCIDGSKITGSDFEGNDEDEGD